MCFPIGFVKNRRRPPGAGCLGRQRKKAAVERPRGLMWAGARSSESLRLCFAGRCRFGTLRLRLAVQSILEADADALTLLHALALERGRQPDVAQADIPNGSIAHDFRLSEWARTVARWPKSASPVRMFVAAAAARRPSRAAVTLRRVLRRAIARHAAPRMKQIRPMGHGRSAIGGLRDAGSDASRHTPTRRRCPTCTARRDRSFHDSTNAYEHGVRPMQRRNALAPARGLR